jgi:hypothetical protein
MNPSMPCHAIRTIQENKEGLQVNATYDLMVHADVVSVLDGTQMP